jgi:hypothetical protein
MCQYRANPATMSLLNFESSGPKPKGEKKSLKLVLGIGALAGVIALGATFASRINLNSGGPVEFGQGLTQATACDGEIKVTPYSAFVNVSGAGSFKLTSIRISGIDSSENKCAGKTFRIKAYGNDRSPLSLFNRTERLLNGDLVESHDYDFVDIARTGGEFVWTSGGSDNNDVINIDNSVVEQTAFTIDLLSAASTITRTPLASADIVKRITIESFVASDAPAATAAAITTQPTGAVSGSSLTQQPVIRIVDANGDTVTNSTVDVVASIASGTGSLTGTTTVAAVAGIATFTDLVITGTAGDFTLTFTPLSLTPITSSSFSITAAAVTYRIGDIGPGGGRIFYVAGSAPYYFPLFNCGPTFSTTGSPTNGKCKYLEAAPVTGDDAWTDATYQWSVSTNTEIGDLAWGLTTGIGYRNTIAMIFQNSAGASLAAFATRVYRGPNNLDDWYLPSRAELFWLINFQTSAMGFMNDEGYWTSSEKDAGSAYSFRSYSGDYPSKDSYFYVRPVRAF